jgi:hypothetical protein
MAFTPELKTILGGGLLLMLSSLVLAVVFLALWFGTLIHCIQHRHDKDRMMWVLICLLGGPIGGILYLAMGRLPRQSHQATSQPPVILSNAIKADPTFDHLAMQDESKRAQAMQDAIWKSAAANKATKSNRGQ